jgi:hypothetical protein
VVRPFFRRLGREWLSEGAGGKFPLIVLAAFVLYRLIHGFVIFDAMAVPEFDFFCFRSVADKFAHFELPSFYKWAPGYPLLMALWPFRFGGADRLLQGGEVVNLVASVGMLLFLYRWARGILGPAAVLAVVITGSYKVFVEHSAQPLCDMALVFFIVAAVSGAGKGKCWPYAAAGAAALTRYEGIALLVLIFLADVRRRRPRLKFLSYALVAALPITAWLALSVLHSQVVNPYVEQMLASKPVGAGFLETVARVMFPAWAPHLGFLAVFFAAVALLGAVILAWRGGAGARVYVAFAVFYIAVHMLFPFSFGKYVLPLIPLISVSLVVGGKQIMAFCGRRLKRASWPGVVGAAAAVLWLVGVSASFVTRRKEPALFVWGAGLPLMAFVTAAIWAAFFPPRVSGIEKRRRLAGLVFPLIFLSLFVNGQVKLWAANWYHFRWRGASLRAAGEALREFVTPNETVCVVWPDIVSFYAYPASFKAIVPARLKAPDERRFPAVAARKGVRYVCYDSISGNDPFGYFALTAGVPLLKPFATGEDVPPYECYNTVVTPGEYVHVYRLRADVGKGRKR